MLYALGSPVVFAALVVAFLLGLAVRAAAIRLAGRALGLANRHESIAPRPREDIDPFGAVAAALGGMGWGKMISVDEVPRHHGRGRAAAVFAAGPVSCIVIAELLFGLYSALYSDNLLAWITPSAVYYGLDVPAAELALLSLAVGLLFFGLLALIPIPPLDGFGLLYCALRRPGAGIQWMRLWFEEKNIGVLVLLALSFFPLSAPILLRILNLFGVFFVAPWA